MQDRDWDEFVESQRTIKAFERLLSIGKKKLNKSQYQIVEDRVMIFLYCHFIEMPSFYHIIANLLRLNNGSDYTIDPFNSAEKRRKLKSVFDRQPVLYPKDKLRIISKLDTKKLIYPLLKDIYNDQIRNAFFHSDFVLTNSEFRIPSKVIGCVIPLAEVRLTIQKSIIFYEYLIRYVEDYKKLYYSLEGKELDLYKPYGEKLKFLYKDKSLIGFEVTRPNNTNSRYTRTEKGTEATNLHFTNKGEVGFFVGDLDFLKQWYSKQIQNEN